MDKPEMYRSNSGDSLNDARKFLEKYKEWMKWKENELVLDVGCGPGDVTVFALKPSIPTTATIIGCDVSPSMIEFANNRYSGSRISFEVMDISGDSLSEKHQHESVDKIFSFYAIHGFRNQRKIVQNFSFLLKPRGQILLLFPIDIPMFRIYEGLLEKPEYQEIHEMIDSLIPLFFRWDDPSEIYTRILCSENFTDIGCNELNATFHFPSLDSYMKLFESVTPVLARLPNDMKQKFLDDCRQIVLDKQMFTETKDEVTYTYKLMEITATKKA